MGTNTQNRRYINFRRLGGGGGGRGQVLGNEHIGILPDYTGWPNKNGTVDFLGLCSDQQLHFFYFAE